MNGETDFDLVPPNAAPLIESLRSYGYSLNTAMADLVDNCISAEAKNISISLQWNGAESRIVIVDDGKGMDEEALRNAMRLGSRDPREARAEDDLGRFGLGLKTASFSQCRSLTVASKSANQHTCIRRWDLDFVSEQKEWKLLKTGPALSKDVIAAIDKQKSGTVVLLDKLDRVVGAVRENDVDARRHFYDRIDSLRTHLALVFHRFLEEPQRLKIFLNGSDDSNRVRPLDPFFVAHTATHVFPTEVKRFSSGYVSVAGYVLPHKDRLSREQYADMTGAVGLNEQQGFYVYRNRRLLVAGSWLGLGGRSGGWTKEEQYKLARIRIDTSSSLDSDWQIDVKKSLAIPPFRLRPWLEKYAHDVRAQARRVFAHRGEYHKEPIDIELMRIWRSSTRDSNRVYKIDRRHPLIDSLRRNKQVAYRHVEPLLRLIEESVPVERIWLDMAEKPEESNEPLGGMSEAEILVLVEGIAEACVGPARIVDTKTIEMICKMDGFVKHKELIRANFNARRKV